MPFSIHSEIKLVLKQMYLTRSRRHHQHHRRCSTEVFRELVVTVSASPHKYQVMAKETAYAMQVDIPFDHQSALVWAVLSKAS